MSKIQLNNNNRNPHSLKKVRQGKLTGNIKATINCGDGHGKKQY